MKSTFVFISGIASILISCSAAPNAGTFFPQIDDGAAVTQGERLDPFHEEWFGKHLAAMGEEPLWSQPLPDQANMVLRVLFLPTFDNPSMMRVTFFRTGNANYVFKQLSGMGGYEPGRLRLETSGGIERRNADKLSGLIAAVAPFSASTPTKPKIGQDDVVCLDGTQVVLEINEGSRYRVLTRHECDLEKDHPIRVLIGELNDLSMGQMIQPNTFEPLG